MINQDRSFEDTFVFARGDAVTQFAYYEEALALLYSHLSGTTPDIGGITFFKINNARSRLSIIDRLLKKKYGSKYSIFWNSLSKQLQAFDRRRNEIVHWTTVTTWSDEPFTSLVPPNYWDEDENTPSLLFDDLVDFTKRCVFFANLLAYFVYMMDGEPFVQPAWHEIFRQPVTYPPQADHPLRQKPEKYRAQQQPSPE